MAVDCNAGHDPERVGYCHAMREITIVLLLAACGGPAKPEPTGPTEQEEIVYEDMPAEEGTPTEEDPGSTGTAPPIDQASVDAGGTGAAACDELIVRTHCTYDMAGDAIPAEAKQAFDDAISSWRDAIQNDATRQAMIDACQMSLDAANDAFASQGC